MHKVIWTTSWGRNVPRPPTSSDDIVNKVMFVTLVCSAIAAVEDHGNFCCVYMIDGSYYYCGCNYNTIVKQLV